MMKIYVIFAIVGWVWALVFGVYLLVRIRRKPPHGFDVIQRHEE